MSQPIPDGWLRETPSLAGRRNPRGVPKTIAAIAFAIGVAIFLGGRVLIGHGAVGGVVALVMGAVVGVFILVPAAKVTRKDRDWFAMAHEYVILRIFYIRTIVWERMNKWYQ